MTLARGVKSRRIFHLRSRENNRLADKNDFLRTILIANNFLVVIDMYISYLLIPFCVLLLVLQSEKADGF